MKTNRSHLINHFWIVSCFFVATCGCFAQAKRDTVDRNRERYQYAKHLESLALSRNDTAMLAEAYYLFGKVELPKDLTKAAEWYSKSLQLLDKRGPSFEKGRLFMNLGYVAKGNKLPDLAESYFDLARKTFIEAKSERGFKQFSGLFKSTKNKLQDFDKGTQAQILMKSGTESLNQKKTFAAKRDLTKSLYLFSDDKTGDFNYQKIFCHNRLALAYILEDSLSEAFRQMELAKQYNRTEFENNLTIQSSFTEANYRYFQATKQWKKALTEYEKLSNIKTEKLEKDREAAISNLYLKYDTNKKEELLKTQQSVIALNEKNLNLQRWFLIGLGTLLVALGGTLFYVFKLYKSNKHISQRNALLLTEQNHRVKNNLQFISSMLNVQKETLRNAGATREIEGIQLRIESMAILQRTLYSGKELSKINIGDFIEEVIDNVLISCDSEYIETEIRIPETHLSTDTSMAIGLIITELCLNSCKYAFKGINNPLISVTMQEQNRNILLFYTDNGIGMDSKILNKSHKGGFGLEMIRLQVEQLNGSIQFENINTIKIEFPSINTMT